MRQAIGRVDIVERDFDVLDGLAVVGRRLYRPLVLVKQGDAANQRQVFHVIAAGSGLAVQKRQLPGKGIDDKHRFQQPLRVAVELQRSRCRSFLASSPSIVCCSRCCRWIACVWLRSSFTVSTRQRFSSSSSSWIAVVVRKIITGPSTRY